MEKREHPDSYIGAFNTIEDVMDVAKRIEASRAAERKDKAKAKELALAITKLTEYPEWAPLAAKIEEMKQSFIQPPEVYYETPGKAGIDYGARSSLTFLTLWIEMQQRYINEEQYAKGD